MGVSSWFFPFSGEHLENREVLKPNLSHESPLNSSPRRAQLRPRAGTPPYTLQSKFHMTESVHHVKADTFELNVLCFPLAMTSTVMQSAVGKLSGQGAIPACNDHRFQFISVLCFFNRERSLAQRADLWCKPCYLLILEKFVWQTGFKGAPAIGGDIGYIWSPDAFHMTSNESCGSARLSRKGGREGQPEVYFLWFQCTIPFPFLFPLLLPILLHWEANTPMPWAYLHHTRLVIVQQDCLAAGTATAISIFMHEFCLCHCDRQMAREQKTRGNEKHCF